MTDAELTLAASDTTSAENLLQAGGYALVRGRSDDVLRARQALNRLEGRLAAAGDSAAAATTQAMDRTLEGIELMAMDRDPEGAEILEATRRSLKGREDRHGLAIALTYLLGESLARSGRWAEALPYLQAFPYPTPLLYRRLGQAYEAEERYADARRAYSLFVLGWRDADPELQSHVRDAQEAIRRVSSVIAE